MKKYRLLLLFISPALLYGVPTKPSDLKLTATKTTVDLSWIDRSDDERGFKIFRNGKFLTIVGSNVTSFTDKGLTPNTFYKYEVMATDDEYKTLHLTDLKAFPTAYGAGANATGGRGGEVYYINRCDGGRKNADKSYDFKGTLGAALHNYDRDKNEHKDKKRVILFAVGGYFDTIYKSTKSERSILVDSPKNYTIAGQSANFLGGVHLLGNVYDKDMSDKVLKPSDIDIKSFDGSNIDKKLKRLALHYSDNFIIRYISAKGAIDNPDNNSKHSTGAVVDLQNSTNGIVDHFSGGFGSYIFTFKKPNTKNGNTIKAGNFTLQYSLVHEGYGGHNVVVPLGLSYKIDQKDLDIAHTDKMTAWHSWVGKYDVHHNSYILIDHRQPANTNSGDSGSFILSSNYTYNWGGRLGRHTGSAKVDLINNVYEKMDRGVDMGKLHKVDFDIDETYDYQAHPLKPKFFANGNLFNGKYYETSQIFSHYVDTEYGSENEKLQSRYISDKAQENRNFPAPKTKSSSVKSYDLSLSGSGVRFDSSGNPIQIDELDKAYIDIANGATHSDFEGLNSMISITKPNDDEIGDISRFAYPKSYLDQWMIDVSKIPSMESEEFTVDDNQNGIADWWESSDIKIKWNGRSVDTTKFDKDSDGMPDWFEKIQGLDMDKADSNEIKKSWYIGKYHIINSAVYTNLDIYLALMAGDFYILSR